MKRVPLLLSFLLALLVYPAQAQDTPSLSNLEISLWPEFDRAEVLVIYQAMLAPDTPLPSPVEIRIPARVGKPTAVAYASEGRLLNLEYVTQEVGEWLVVSFELSAPEFQLEYYDDQLLIHPDGRREFSFSYQADYPTDGFGLQVQVPPHSEEFDLQPAADSVAAGDYGLDYHFAEAGPLEPGQVLAWSLSYVNASSILTEDILFPEPSQPTQTTQPELATAEEGHDSTALIFVLGLGATLAVGVGAFWLGRRTQPLPEPPPSKRRKRRGSGRGRTSGSAQDRLPDGVEAAFCFQCGAELRPDSDFCHQCGAQARR
jgi:hypothetical protein